MPQGNGVKVGQRLRIALGIAADLVLPEVRHPARGAMRVVPESPVNEDEDVADSEVR